MLDIASLLGAESQDMTEIIAVIDKSGSMEKVKTDAIGGFNTFLEEQKKGPGKANFTLVLFDSKYKVAYRGTTINEVQSLTDETYKPDGWTALFDAVGFAIAETKSRLESLKENERPKKVIIAILTDGEENYSKEYKDRNVIFNMIKEQQEKGWEFLFLGANQDAIAVGSQIGITPDKSFTYAASAIGTRDAYKKMSRAVSSYRSSGSIDNKWKDN